MKNKIFISLFLLGVFGLVSLMIPADAPSFKGKDNVIDVLKTLGDQASKHYPEMDIKGVSSKAGRQIIKYGVTIGPKGGKVKKQSKHFVCTSCHNIVQEDPDLSVSDPVARLEYTNKLGVPFLQGTTLYGAVNRLTFYNDDYEKKYGALVEAARHDIREAIQLCAVECAQGRKLKPWELESVLSYMWDIQLKMEDLILSPNELEYIDNAIKGEADKYEAISLIKSKYLDGAPANFIDPPKDRLQGTSSASNPEKGKLVYENSCLHCHENQRYSYFMLDNSKLTFKYLRNKITGYGPHSLYQVVRYGVDSKAGKRSYMPKYPVEKMDKQQLDDLRLYIERMAE